MNVVLVTGGFDPVHSGHIAYLNHAQHLGDHLIIGLNSDIWLERKKGKAFMSWRERMIILDNLHMTDDIIAFDDTDDTACDAIRQVKMQYPNDHIIFANGGDRTADNIPEMIFDDVEFVFGVGGASKANSSSWLLNEWKAPKTKRQWGYYRVLHDVLGTKVKELTVEPNQSLSLQKHANRSEFWHVTEGKCIVERYSLPPITLSQHQQIHIPVNEWHKLTNPFDAACKIVEIQYGSYCDEQDIERKD